MAGECLFLLQLRVKWVKTVHFARPDTYFSSEFSQNWLRLGMASPKTYDVVFSRELDWASAICLTDFCFPWLDIPVPRTEFRALWDGERFHFQFDVEDNDLVLDESGEPHQAALGSDRVEIFFSPTEDLSEPYFGIEMEPRGAVYDYKGVFHRQFDDSWEMEGLEFSGEISESGNYRVTGHIPIKTLTDLQCIDSNGEMVAGVYRAEFSHLPNGSIDQNWIAWVDPKTEVPDFHVPASFGRLVFQNWQ